MFVRNILFQYSKHVYIAKNWKITIYLTKFKGNKLYAWNCRCAVPTFPYKNIDSTPFKTLTVKEKVYAIFNTAYETGGQHCNKWEIFLTNSYIL